MPIITNSPFPNISFRLFIYFISSIQGTHHGAQKFNKTYLPRKSCKETKSPSIFFCVKSGAKDPGVVRLILSLIQRPNREFWISGDNFSYRDVTESIDTLLIRIASLSILT